MAIWAPREELLLPQFPGGIGERRGSGTIMRLILTVGLCCWALGAASGQEIIPPQPILDLAQCKMAAIRGGNWNRDGWNARTPTGEHLVVCMQAKGYRLGCSGDANFNIEIEGCWQK